MFTNMSFRGAYCAMVTISLLNLPLELPPEAEARKYGLRTFLDGLPEYLSRCEFEKYATMTTLTKWQVKHMKADCPESRVLQRPMVHMHSVCWPVCVSWVNRRI